jgi:hypothetical protein
MKKNKFMRLASVMLMLCLITTCAISGTFAKYTTNGKAQDSARVAKWGMVITVTGDNAFADAYDVGAGVKTVVSQGATGDSVVAPGTYGILATVAIDGRPEVSTKLTTKIDLDLTNWNATYNNGTNTVPYCPIVFTVGAETYGLTKIKEADGLAVVDHQYNTIAELETAVIDAILNKVYAGEAATDITPAGDIDKVVYKDYNAQGMVDFTPDFTVSWGWAFEGGYDTSDTALGDQTGTVPQISFSIDITAEQID